VVGGVDVRHVEQLAPEAWTTIQTAWRLHDALEYSGTATSTFTGLSHLEGRTDVYVWANGQEAGPLTVTGGSITLPFSVTYAIAGLKYSGRYKSGRLPGGTLTANKQIEKLGLLLHKTAGGSVKYGADFDDMERLDDRIDDGTLVFDGPVQEINADMEMNIHGFTERDPRLCIAMDTAGPATILALVETIKANS